MFINSIIIIVPSSLGSFRLLNWELPDSDCFQHCHAQRRVGIVRKEGRTVAGHPLRSLVAWVVLDLDSCGNLVVSPGGNRVVQNRQAAIHWDYCPLS